MISTELQNWLAAPAERHLVPLMTKEVVRHRLLVELSGAGMSPSNFFLDQATAPHLLPADVVVGSPPEAVIQLLYLKGRDIDQFGSRRASLDWMVRMLSELETQHADDRVMLVVIEPEVVVMMSEFFVGLGQAGVGAQLTTVPEAFRHFDNVGSGVPFIAQSSVLEFRNLSVAHPTDDGRTLVAFYRYEKSIPI